MSAEGGLPLDRFLLLPLDITTPHELPFPTYKERVDPAFDSTAKPSDGSAKPPLPHFTSAFLERTREIMCSFGKDAMELHDPVAMWCAIENPPNPTSGGRLHTGWRSISRTFAIERYVFLFGARAILTSYYMLPLTHTHPGEFTANLSCFFFFSPPKIEGPASSPVACASSTGGRMLPLTRPGSIAPMYKQSGNQRLFRHASKWRTLPMLIPRQRGVLKRKLRVHRVQRRMARVQEFR
jgi:hypothetical protein